MLRTVLLPLLAMTGCGGEPGGEAAPQPPAPLEHDFGTITHGRAPEHVFAVALPGGGAGLIPATFRSSCSCGVPRLLIRRAGGETQAIDGLPPALRTLQRGDELLLSLVVDTSRKEAADHDKVTVHGQIVLERPDDEDPLIVPVIYHFAIDAPIEVRPAPHVAFGALPVSRRYAQPVELHPDRRDPPVSFGPVEVDDPRVHAELHEEEGVTRLEVRFEPAPNPTPGPVHATVRVPTDLDGYVLEIPVSGQLIDDIVVEPFARISFERIEMDQPAEKFVNVTDHDTGRPAGFAVGGITDTKGADLSRHFEARFEPIAGEERSTRVFLRYLGTLDADAFRGVLRLTKPGGKGPVTDIEFLGFAK